MYHAAFRAMAIVALTAPALSAAELAPPQDDVILTVSGAIGNTNADDTAQFDLAMLESLDSTSFDTSTIWTEGVDSFTGVPLQALIEAVGAEGTTLRATAINDYTVEIPVSDAVEGGPIVAYLMNGETMSVRDKGPLWVIYPYDDNADYRTEVVYSRSIWQLDRLEVVD